MPELACAHSKSTLPLFNELPRVAVLGNCLNPPFLEVTGWDTWAVKKGFTEH